MPILLGERIPGIIMSDELRKKIPELIEKCKSFGLDPFDLVYDVYSYDEIAEICAYVGFPVRYPHYKFGEAYEELARGQEYGFQKVYELVVNSDPSYVYLLEGNTYVDQVTVIIHALAHSDFFKNNIFYSKTNRNMINEMANHGTRIQRYCRRFGRDTVTKFLDCILSLSDLLDPAKVWDSKRYQAPQIHDKIKHEEPKRIRVDEDSSYMDHFINPSDFLEDQKKAILFKQKKKLESWPAKPERDILGFLMSHAPLQPWQRDVMGMIREESYYFLPQIMTKIVNEGWASYWDSFMMAGENLAGDEGIIDYALHKAGTLGGRYSSNPYKLGYMLFQYAEECYNKGRVPGTVHPEWDVRWEDCTDRQQREKWDLGWGKGREKIFEIRKLYNDVQLVQEFMTQDFCDEYEYFKWKKNREGEIVIASRDAKEISEEIVDRLDNQGRPVTQLINVNGFNRGILELEHKYTGRRLNARMTELTLMRLFQIWRRPVSMRSRAKGRDIVYLCMDGENVSSTPLDNYKEAVRGV